jgi:hypothetical protein
VGARARRSTSRASGARTVAALRITVAAYRDRYEVASDRPVSGGAASDVQRPDRARARSALRDAAAVATGRRWPQRPRRAAIQATLPP